ncbi:NUDIX hydrolase [Roseomonas harenae]|uniref:NUDIX hydrolase n=1 Tax=Muricoccus harenae TaxID=2692566 RepID=UPI001331ABF6|nr:NUDIX hydrolase [Roseomonas harenae]
MTNKEMTRTAKKRVGKQFAALPLAIREGEVKVMLVTSRETRRWVLPKGWAEPDLAPHELAAKEAYEEAGLIGEVDPRPVGFYRYYKRLRDGRSRPCKVGVFRLWVTRQLEDWPEREQRETRWFTPAQAAMEVDEGGLVTLLLHLAIQEG